MALRTCIAAVVVMTSLVARPQQEKLAAFAVLGSADIEKEKLAAFAALGSADIEKEKLAAFAALGSADLEKEKLEAFAALGSADSEKAGAHKIFGANGSKCGLWKPKQCSFWQQILLRRI